MNQRQIMATSKSPADDKVFDVAKPGKTTAASTSKPVIIGHKNMLKDPMVKEESVGIISGTENTDQSLVDPNDKPSGNPQPTPAETEPGTAPMVPRIKIEPTSGEVSTDEIKPPTTTSTPEAPKKSVKLQIIPPEQTEVKPPEEKPAESAPAPVTVKTKESATKAPDTEETATKTSAAKKPAPAKNTAKSEETKITVKKAEPKALAPEPVAKAEDKVEEKAEDSIPEDDSPSEAQETSSTAEETKAVASAAAAQADPLKKAEKQAQEDAAKQKSLERLIASKKYYAPIGEKTRKRSNQKAVLFLLLFIILAGAAFYLLIDVEIIPVNFELPYELINN
jgi:hypothetical protein